MRVSDFFLPSRKQEKGNNIFFLRQGTAMKKSSTRRRKGKSRPALGKRAYRVPDYSSSSHEIIMFGFHKVPKTDEDIKTYKHLRSAVPEQNDTNDTIFKKISSVFQSSVISGMKYMHCEVAFKKTMFQDTSDAPDTAIAYGVFNTTRDGERGKVWVRERTYMNPNYDWVFLEVPKKMGYIYAKFHQDQVGKPFDPSGLRGVYTIPGKCDGSSWFCVSLHMYGAEKAKLINGYLKDCTSTTVDEFYDIINNSEYKVRMGMIPLDQHRYSKVTIDELLPEFYAPPSERTKGRRTVSTPIIENNGIIRHTSTGANIGRGLQAFESTMPGVVVPTYSGRRRKKGVNKTEKRPIFVDCFLPES